MILRASFVTVLMYCLLLQRYAFCQQTYYISNNGNDNNSGLSVSTPIRTINKVNGISLSPGSKLLFRRGDLFEGALTVKQSGSTSAPITIDAYGDGNKPIISGSTSITNWSSSGNDGIWQATCNQCGSTVTGLYINSIPQTLGRFPNNDDANGGYISVKAHVGNSTLVSSQNLTTNWAGGEVVVRSNYFIIDRATITQQNSNTLTLSNSSIYQLADNFGFFIQNNLATLDKQGEWYYNSSTKTIYLYNSIGSPNDQQIRASISSIGVDIRGQSNIVVQNIQTKEQLNYGIYCENGINITLRNCLIASQGENGVWFSGSGNTVLVENNEIHDINNNGFQIDQYTNFIFRGNNLNRIAVSPGRGKSGDAQYIGALLYSTQSTIESNTIDSTGYSALVIPKNYATVQRNVLSNFCLAKSDGGGIYMNNNTKETVQNIVIQNNVIYNGIGVPEGSPDGFSGANGIYLDNCISNTSVVKNTVFSCRHYGIYLHDVQKITVDGNTSYDNKDSQFVIDYTTDCITTNNIIQNNIFVSKLTNQYTAIYDSYNANLGTFGTFSNNVYSRPLEDTQTLRLSYSPPNGGLFDPQTLQQWQSLYGKDLNSKKSPVNYKNYYVNSIIGTERVVGGDFTSGSGYGIGGPFIFSNYNNGQGTWDNNNRISGGSLNLNFTSITNNPGASLYAAQVVNGVSSTKKYLVSFDAVSTVNDRVVQVYMQTQFAPFREITLRPAIIVGTSVKHYEFVFQPTYDEQNALLVLRVFENSQPLFVDNLSFKECDATIFPSEAFINFFYNPTEKDSVVSSVGLYKDVNSTTYAGDFIIPAFSSLVLFRNNQFQLANADLRMDLTVDKLNPAINEIVNVGVRLKNEQSLYPNNIPARAIWALRLPPNVQVTSYSGLQMNNNVITGRVQDLVNGADTTANFKIKIVSAGAYNIGVQVTSTLYYDPDSTPNSGIADGEDDQDHVTIRSRLATGDTYTSPNTNSVTLPNPLVSEPLAVTGQSDLSLRVYTDRSEIAVGEIVKFNIVVNNRGGGIARNVKVQNLLPAGMQYIGGDLWVASGFTLTRTISFIPPRGSFLISFSAKSVLSGRLVNQVQIASSDLTDPDSTPGNGYMIGEDDDGFVFILVK
ncbi:right-handed parallel beta-helix repeat-containing protein [uncultured Spirosoma sp.]|uniref:right-handed parallel beta-helix repeat-containing protein n=1 Tax=uncultured Spirosoma sp. TaxID=278208 RepID=UPI00258D3887|nr:right-handed parallel beta-helix repeat-containing protein [uncultured Spirosoma sp.]